jgi:ATP-dependent DNA helicase DinG
MKQSSIQKQYLYLIREIFTNILPQHLPSSEIREQQIVMAEQILQSFIENKKIVVEAPTGIGKSLAYLIPSVIYLKEFQKNVRIIISTYTKTLQQQLLKKDLPLVEKIVHQWYKDKILYTTFFGSENYICLSKFYELKKDFLTPDEVLKVAYIEEWLNTTQTGCNEEIEIDSDFWQEINRESDLCRNKHCKFYSNCYYYKNLKKLKDMDIIIVNHHLFFANLLAFNNILPKKDEETEEIIIFDEAHNLEDVIYQWFGQELSNTQIKFLCKQIYNLKKQRGLITKLHSLPESLKQNIIDSIVSILECNEEFFAQINLKLLQDKPEARIFLPNIVENTLTPQLSKLFNLLNSAKNLVSKREEVYKLSVFINRIVKFIKILTLWLKCEDTKNYIYWVEKEETKRKKLKITLKITPIDLTKEMQQYVYSVYNKIVFTSATLCVNSDFKFFKSSVGLYPEIIPESTTSNELVLTSPFDYKNNVVIYLPDGVPNPKYEYEKYKEVITEIITKLVELTKGNTFVLFTSFELMNWVVEHIKLEYKLFVQSISKYKLLEQYKKTENSVLFGVDTFWQGVDIPGEKLISIIIPKLPFDVPDHPVIEAKTEKLQFEGKDPFKEYLLPNAILKLKQGFGRLIRRKTDWGIISILDPRIKIQWYGKHFLKSLPECKITTDFETLKEFYYTKKTCSQ